MEVGRSGEGLEAAGRSWRVPGEQGTRYPE